MPIDPSKVQWDAPAAIDPAKVIWDAPAAPDPTAGMSTGDKVLAGIGGGMVSVGRALGLGGVAERFGLPGTKEEAAKLDAPLMATTAGKVGDFVGRAVTAAPAALIPGGQSLAGAALIGAGTGALTTEGGVGDRLAGAAGGAAGGAGGVLLGRGLGWTADKLLGRATKNAAAAEVANAGRDAALAAGRAEGYVVTPSQAGQGGLLNSALEALGGKIKTQQAASVRNANVTNDLARRAIGLSPDEPITQAALDAVRKEAGQAYGAVAGLGPMPVSGNTLPAGVAVQRFTDPLTMAPRAQVDAGELVRAWKQANADANAWFRAARRSANPEDLAKAKSFASAARQIDEYLTAQLEATGQKDLLSALKEARARIAKTYTVEKALNEDTGSVSARELARELQKGKPLSGELRTAAKFARAFPKAAQDGVDVPAWSVIDMLGASGASLTGMSPVAAMFAARPVARAAVLNPLYQGLMVNPSYGPGLVTRTAAPVLNSDIARRFLQVNGMTAGAQSAVQP